MNTKTTSHDQEAPPALKPLRADARRNCELLLTTAREVFSAGQLELRMKDIARRASASARSTGISRLERR